MSGRGFGNPFLALSGKIDGQFNSLIAHRQMVNGQLRVAAANHILGEQAAQVQHGRNVELLGIQHQHDVNLANVQAQHGLDLENVQHQHNVEMGIRQSNQASTLSNQEHNQQMARTQQGFQNDIAMLREHARLGKSLGQAAVQGNYQVTAGPFSASPAPRKPKKSGGTVTSNPGGRTTQFPETEGGAAESETP